MTGTSLKDVGLMFGSMGASGNVSARSLTESGFQRVWDEQSGNGNNTDAADNRQPVARKIRRQRQRSKSLP